jgi:ATP-dependent helicase HrpA
VHYEGVQQQLRQWLGALLKGLQKDHGISQPAQLAWTRIEDMKSLSAALRHMVLRQLLSEAAAWALRDPEAVKACADRLRSQLTPAYRLVAKHCNEALMAWHQVDRRLTELEMAAPTNIADLRSQLDDLMYGGFIDHISADRLSHYPRYLKAMALRLDALEQDPRRDSVRMAEVSPWWQAYLDHLANQAWYSEAVDDYRWLIEEYRVQQFAQQLGTAEKVSPKRLQAAASIAGIATVAGP